MSKERPILFSGPMVRALLDGSKTQTRRVCKPQPIADARFVGGHHLPATKRNPGREISVEAPYVHIACPYGQRGDRLWVRESFAHMYRDNAQPEKRAPEDVAYMADNLTPDPYVYGSWKPSIHMPRWASRITLEITSVRVERLQDISADDARAEGCPDRPIPGAEQASVDLLAKLWYHDLWEQINGPDSWAANPWVWAIEFRRLP